MNFSVCECVRAQLGGICTLIAELGGKICRGEGVVFIGVSRSDDVSGPALHCLGFYSGVTSGS